MPYTPKNKPSKTNNQTLIEEIRKNPSPPLQVGKTGENKKTIQVKEKYVRKREKKELLSFIEKISGKIGYISILGIALVAVYTVALFYEVITNGVFIPREVSSYFVYSRFLPGTILATLICYLIKGISKKKKKQVIKKSNGVLID